VFVIHFQIFFIKTLKKTLGLGFLLHIKNVDTHNVRFSSKKKTSNKKVNANKPLK